MKGPQVVVLFTGSPFGSLQPLHVSLFVFQAYTDELVELHRRLMALRERNVLQQVQSWPWGLGVQGSASALL